MEQEKDNNQINIPEDLSNSQARGGRKDPKRIYYIIALVVILLILVSLLFIFVERQPRFTEEERKEIIKREVERESQREERPAVEEEKIEEVENALAEQGIQPLSEEQAEGMKGRFESFLQSN